MPSLSRDKNDASTVSALSLRNNPRKIPRCIEIEQRSFVIEKRGTPTAVLLNMHDCVKLAASEPEVLKIIGDEAKRKKAAILSSRQIDQIVRAARSAKKKR